MSFDLTLEQLTIVGIVASALVLALRLAYEIAAKRGVTLPDYVMLAIVYVASLGLAILFFPQSLPVWPGFPPIGGEPVGMAAAILAYAGIFLAWLGEWLILLTAYTTAAAFIYDKLLIKVKEGLQKKFAPKAYAVTVAKKKSG